MQRNLHKLKLHLQYIEEQGESSRLEASVVHEIVNTSLDSDLLKQYNKEFMDVRTKQKKKLVGVHPEVTESNFALYFDSDKLQTKRLTFLSTFIETALEYQLIYHKGARALKCSHPSNPSEHLPDSQPSLLINKQEAYICELCKTNHPDPKSGRSRRWYLNDTCPVFKGWDSNTKGNYLNKARLCRICSNPKGDKNHVDGKCPHV